MRTCKVCTKTEDIEPFPKAGYLCKKCFYQKYIVPNLAQYNEKAKAYYWANREKVRAKYNTEEYKQKMATYKKVYRRKTKAYSNLRRGITKRIKVLLNYQNAGLKYRDIIGCSPAELRTHIESHFSSEMSWQNRGTVWHLDHIIPESAFDPKNPKHVKWCWHHKNLDPKLKEDNYRKYDYLPSGKTVRQLKKDNIETLHAEVASMLEAQGITTKEEYYSSLDNKEVLVLLDV